MGLANLIGSVLIITASTMAGFLLASRYRQRPRQIRQWRSALQSIEAEIIYGRVPVEQLALDLSKQLPQPLSRFFLILQEMLNKDHLPLQKAWPTAVARFWPETAMKNSEREVILQFGTTLGTEDAANQEKHIHLALSHLEREEADARSEQSTNEKMMRSLGFLAGILIVLLLI